MAETETSGGGGGGTNWHNVSLPTMWAWVNQDLAPFYNQASSWEKTSELCGLYSRRLEAFRERLAQSWNPDTSPASQAFLTKLDELITSVKDVNTVASNNYQPAKDIASAIAEAKRNLEPYYNQAQQAETPQDYENAHRNAARVMGVLSSDLSNARTGIGEPRPYVAPAPPGKDTGGGGGGDYSGGPAAPFIPPVVPVPPPQSPPPMTPPGPMTPMPAPKGPDLVGLNPPPPGPGPGPMQPMPPGGHPPVGPGPVPPGPVIRPPVIGGPPPVSPVRPTPPIGRPVGPMTPPLTGPGRGPTTGIIGGQPPAGGRGPGGLRANPVGGMIGSPNTARPGAAGGPGGRGVVGGLGAAGAAGRGPGAAGAAGRGALVGGAAGRGANQHDEDGEHFDPDTAWDVAEGVTPVLEAPDNQGPIDPGPAIGLSR